MLSMYPFPAALTLFPLKPFTEEVTGYINEAAKGANKALRNPRLFVSCFTVSMTPSVWIF